MPRRRLRAVCPGVLDEVGGLFRKPTKGLDFHYPGEGPEECKFCHPTPSWYKRFWKWLRTDSAPWVPLPGQPSVPWEEE